jgi:hypothetical protein
LGGGDEGFGEIDAEDVGHFAGELKSAAADGTAKVEGAGGS